MSAETLAVLALGLAARARLAVRFFDVVSFSARCVVVVNGALHRVPRRCFCHIRNLLVIPACLSADERSRQNRSCATPMRFATS